MKSVVNYPERGEGGSSRYRGNCSPKLVEDIIKQYQLSSLNDYMVGGGTTEDVCRRLNIPTHCHDLNRGYDMMTMDIPERAENIMWHPPYDSIIVYSDVMYKAQDIIDQYGFDPRVNDLSRCKSWEDFVRKMNYCCLKQYSALDKGGRMFILVGDIKKKSRLYSMQRELMLPGTLEQYIIKQQWNCVSDRKSYSNSNFVPIVHEYLIVLRKDNAVVYDISYAKHTSQDIRDCVSATWRDVVASILQDTKKPLNLQQIYEEMDGHRRCNTNNHWKEKIRQTLQKYSCFKNVGRGVWQIAA